MGFAKVFDVSFAAGMTIVEEVDEFFKLSFSAGNVRFCCKKDYV
jgi:iron only hydrogenase large subunit-like protein